VFATKWVPGTNGFQLKAFGQPYTNLLTDLIREPRLKRFKLHAASRLAPKLPGALNIEGLCATPDRKLLIGFRNPIPLGRALLIPLLNPNDLIQGRPARFDDPVLLDLGGFGVRDLGYWHDRFIIVAGSYDGSGDTRLYQWRGRGSRPERLAGVELHDFNAEAVIVYPDGRRPFQLLSDDGTRLFDGTICKKLSDPAERKYRSLWITPLPTE
jgi:hypothetical protein